MFVIILVFMGLSNFPISLRAPKNLLCRMDLGQVLYYTRGPMHQFEHRQGPCGRLAGLTPDPGRGRRSGAGPVPGRGRRRLAGESIRAPALNLIAFGHSSHLTYIYIYLVIYLYIYMYIISDWLFLWRTLKDTHSQHPQLRSLSSNICIIGNLTSL